MFHTFYKKTNFHDLVNHIAQSVRYTKTEQFSKSTPANFIDNNDFEK